jgi:hypothetical protein
VNRILPFAAVLAISFGAQAQDQDIAEEFVVVLPDAAQECVLPAAPDTIPENATLDQLKAAKADVDEFQGQVAEFRACLQKAEADPNNTQGNQQAIVDSFNYSVDMEERVATRFNEAVRDYKARQAAAEG